MSKLFEDEIEAEACRLVGKLLFIYGRLEMNLALWIVRFLPVEQFQSEIVDMEDRSFFEKLECLQQGIEITYREHAELAQSWYKWCLAAHWLRELRNRFAHGRWGILYAQQMVAHVCNLPGSPNQIETRYTLAELAHQIDEAERVARDFDALCKRCAGIGGC